MCVAWLYYVAFANVIVDVNCGAESGCHSLRGQQRRLPFAGSSALNCLDNCAAIVRRASVESLGRVQMNGVHSFGNYSMFVCMCVLVFRNVDIARLFV